MSDYWQDLKQRSEQLIREWCNGEGFHRAILVCGPLDARPAPMRLVFGRDNPVTCLLLLRHQSTIRTLDEWVATKPLISDDDKAEIISAFDFMPTLFRMQRSGCGCLSAISMYWSMTESVWLNDVTIWYEDRIRPVRYCPECGNMLPRLNTSSEESSSEADRFSRLIC